ncbi:hypothetical protein CYMTET_11150 [Cymbomonas tetramitiformis]|uniref:Uncharacterized protein n=1 Tax=Cymbomonas tetramitiformis TaxID=36881 RepID=A0AAE0GN11_9CHLO|nr:hypothetical protein CYMTET_11150 [Cymbomonas tetramitiformis]
MLASAKERYLTPHNLQGKPTSAIVPVSMLKPQADKQLARAACTPVYLAVKEGRLELLEVLLGAGADRNSADTPAEGYECGVGSAAQEERKCGWTPLHLAARRGCRSSVRELIAFGAELSSQTPEGKTALDVARALQHDECVEFLSLQGLSMPSPGASEGEIQSVTRTEIGEDAGRSTPADEPQRPRSVGMPEAPSGLAEIGMQRARDMEEKAENILQEVWQSGEEETLNRVRDPEEASRCPDEDVRNAQGEVCGDVNRAEHGEETCGQQRGAMQRRVEQEMERKGERVRRIEEEVQSKVREDEEARKRVEEEARRRVEKEMRQKEQGVRRIEEEVREKLQEEEEVFRKRLEEEARRRVEEEIQRKEEEIREKRQKEEEARRRMEEEMQRKEEEIRARAEEILRKEQEVQRKEEAAAAALAEERQRWAEMERWRLDAERQKWEQQRLSDIETERARWREEQKQAEVARCMLAQQELRQKNEEDMGTMIEQARLKLAAEHARAEAAKKVQAVEQERLAAEADLSRKQFEARMQRSIKASMGPDVHLRHAAVKPSTSSPVARPEGDAPAAWSARQRGGRQAVEGCIGATVVDPGLASSLGPTPVPPTVPEWMPDERYIGSFMKGWEEEEARRHSREQQRLEGPARRQRAEEEEREREQFRLAELARQKHVEQEEWERQRELQRHRYKPPGGCCGQRSVLLSDGQCQLQPAISLRRLCDSLRYNLAVEEMPETPTGRVPYMV